MEPVDDLAHAGEVVSKLYGVWFCVDVFARGQVGRGRSVIIRNIFDKR